MRPLKKYLKCHSCPVFVIPEQSGIYNCDFLHTAIYFLDILLWFTIILDMKKNSKEPFPKKERFTILLEDLSKKFEVVSEGVNSKIDGLETRLTERINNVDNKIEDVKLALKVVREDLSNRIDGTNKRIDETRNELLTKINATRQELKDVKNGMAGLELKLDTVRYGLSEKIDSARQEISDIKEDICKKIENYEERLIKLEK
ncbi:MAG: hypothetical protein BWY26_01209 [Elusimicrobia bacterium ADurb.Bin231]|nr:MAG: hypothetical protein BWY26_01209 [Elusimicrobia bacterium ADurb.Bin231]